MSELRVDLKNSTITPASSKFSEMIEHYRQMLATQLTARLLPSAWLKGAEIQVIFSGQKHTDKTGDAFECVVTLTDDLGRQHQARQNGACWAT
ncbi:hypothetical protein [Terricaulis silvestris]|uniref:hypothetical protein n=1 Tax=Terricaulis silvestris TaxID=2686094 RepID=UPI00131B99E8|nr:hypothetical protein [Terricaulis silvestris]